MSLPTLTGAEPRQLLRIYLNDHLTGASAAIELAKRCLSSNQGTTLAEDLEAFLSEAEEDRTVLRDLMATLEIPEDPVKKVAAVVAERAGRLKLNGQLVGYSPLSRLLELEGLCVGIEGKLGLWRSLQCLEDTNGAIAAVDLKRLIDRAADQRRVLEVHRLEAAVAALA